MSHVGSIPFAALTTIAAMPYVSTSLQRSGPQSAWVFAVARVGRPLLAFAVPGGELQTQLEAVARAQDVADHDRGAVG